MANPLDDFINARVKKPFSMTEEDYLPQGEVTFSPEDKSAGIPIKGATVNAQGKTTAPIEGMRVSGNVPVSTARVEEIKKIFAPAAPEMAPIPPTTPVPETPAKVPPVEEKGFDWASLLPALAPLATEALMSGGGTAGESLGIAGSHLLTQEGKKETRKNELENKLLDMQKARDLASIKAESKGQKYLEVKGPNGEPIITPSGEAAYKEAWKAAPKPPSGLSAEEWNRRQNYTYRLKSGLEKDKLSAKEKKDNRDLEVKLEKQWSSDEFTKGTRKVADSYKRLAKLDPNNTNRIEEMGAIFDLMKALDEKSVVRESEQAMAIGARSYTDVVNYFDSILSGEKQLTPTQLRNIKKFAEGLYRNRMESQKDLDKGYTERAKRYSLNAENIVQNISSAPIPKELPKEGESVEQDGVIFTMGKNGEWK
jgi:hypothetical protein